MTIATAPLRHTQVAAVGGAKRFSATRKSLLSSEVSPFDSILVVRFNPDWSEGLTTGVAAAAATVEIDATNIILDVDGVLDRNIAHSGLTVQEMVDAIMHFLRNPDLLCLFRQVKNRLLRLSQTVRVNHKQ